MFLLGAALAAAALIPYIVIDNIVQLLADVTGAWWARVPESFITTATGFTFSTVAEAVAAVDVRNRYEGADLHAALDAPAPVA
jgi:hypothetical protein